jgi:hypothetical protein
MLAADSEMTVAGPLKHKRTLGFVEKARPRHAGDDPADFGDGNARA